MTSNMNPTPNSLEQKWVELNQKPEDENDQADTRGEGAGKEAETDDKTSPDQTAGSPVESLNVFAEADLEGVEHLMARATTGEKLEVHMFNDGNWQKIMAEILKAIKLVEEKESKLMSQEIHGAKADTFAERQAIEALKKRIEDFLGILSDNEDKMVIVDNESFKTAEYLKEKVTPEFSFLINREVFENQLRPGLAEYDFKEILGPEGEPIGYQAKFELEEVNFDMAFIFSAEEPESALAA